LLGRNKGDLEKEMKIVRAINRNIKTNFRLAKCANICLKKGRVQSETDIGSTLVKDIEELDPRKP
jgi:hypothetical protein